MPLIIRLGDTSDHGGEVITSCQKYRFEGALAARKGDLFDCPIHGVNPIVEGSAKYSFEGAPVARQGDHTACGATLISGAVKYSFE